MKTFRGMMISFSSWNATVRLKDAEGERFPGGSKGMN